MTEGAPQPKLYIIPAGAPFLDCLAAGIVQRHGANDGIGDITVLLPTRRACRALADAFLRHSGGKPMLLPAIRPLGDIDEEDLLLHGFAAGVEDLPAIDPMRRQLMLARLVMASGMAGAEPAIAIALAAALGELIDSAAIEELGFEALEKLVPDDYSKHWQKVLKFLGLARDTWPEILAAEGAVDAATRRIRLMRALIERWRAHAPAHPVYVAGSTGTIPATADLLGLISRLPQGGLIVEGLDAGLDDDSWQQVLDDPVHPQHTLSRLLARIGIDRREALPWIADAGIAGSPRFRLFSDALRPAAGSGDIAAMQRRIAATPGDAFKGLRRFECASPREEALAIALELRGALEVPGRTAALITPDRQLARRVASELGRWGIPADDSGGTPLARTPPGAFLHLVAELLGQSFAPVALLSVLKHPLCRVGRARDDLLRETRLLDRSVLRGLRPAPGLSGIEARLAALDDFEISNDDRNTLAALLHDLAAAARPVTEALAHTPVDFAAVIENLARFAEWLATEPGAEASLLWQREAGTGLAEFIDDLRQAAPGLGDFGMDAVARHRLAPIIHGLMQGRVVRPRREQHPRIFIWGQLEARLQHADLVVLGGLNEGTWPPEALEDPWLNRRMRAEFGLPSPERRIGQTAHDFLMAASGAEVVLSRSARVEGAETVPSRWLMRLGAALDGDRRWQASLDQTMPMLAASLDRSNEPPPLIEPPRPRPPVAARPTKLSVTQIETLIRDPYAIYARHVLDLKVLDEIEAEAGAPERGTVIHEAMEHFIAAHKEALPVDALLQLRDIGRKAFGDLINEPMIRTFWWPRFLRAAAWFLAKEAERRAAGIRPLAVECSGELRIGAFTLRAKADRIDLLPDGSLAIIDYKTGKPPGAKEVRIGLAPQLPLEAAMAMRGAFPGVDARKVGELLYVRLSGQGEGGEMREIEERGKRLDPTGLADTAYARLERMIERFNKVDTAYPSRLRPKFKDQPGDYDHLARAGEWPPEFGDDE